MKKILPIISIILILFTILSCDSSLQPMEEGNVNYNIYPYLEFELSYDSTYYIAYVVEGAKITSVTIPGEKHTDFGAMPVKVFGGFTDPEDAVNLKTVYIDVNVDRISEGAFDYAYSLERVITTGTDDGQNWAKLPPSLTRDGYHFHGWKVGDTIYDGESTISISPDAPVAQPYFVALEHHEAVSPTCTEEGSIEHWKCPECGKLYTDSHAENSVNSVSIPLTGHLYPLVHKEYVAPTCQTEGNVEYWRCDRCMEAFTDETGTEILENYILAKVPHESDGETYSSETVHYHKCRWCGTVMDEEEHSFVLWIIDTPATEHTKGLKHADCSECGYRKTVEIPEHDHFDYEPAKKVKNDASCLEGAYYLETCGNPECGEVLKVLIENEPALGHRGTVYDYKDSTCTAAGTLAHIWCDVCEAPYENRWSKDKMKTTEVPLKAHDFSTVWTIGEDTHYHLCRSCGIARSDETRHVYKQVVDKKYLKYSSTCQHANQYVESCECGKEGTKLFESGEIGDHEYSVVKPFDAEYHYNHCRYCDEKDPDTKEKHRFVPSSEGKKCEICGYVVPNAEGGFDVSILDKSPKGHIEVISRTSSTITFRFVDEKPDYPPLEIRWFVGNILIKTEIDEEGDGFDTFTASTPLPMTYKVNCSFTNTSGTGSCSITVTGGVQ